ncbi:hypothetical protein BJX61DRAFT_209620 [Aspergillus egyptiacus]|nr:hypothetical protein BJX61DRAFT_209620 [Aspergillus egyptiacus]
MAWNITACRERCFMCGNRARSQARIIAEEDDSTPILMSRGLINFHLASEMNRVALCPNCHSNFDDHCDPKLIFYPVDIRFFIRYELRDRIRRQKDGSPRRVPTARQYADWAGSLYQRIFFDVRATNIPRIVEPAQWGGAPLASFRRVFGMMGSPRARGIPKQDREDLRVLWELYYGNEENGIGAVMAEYQEGNGDQDFGLGELSDDEGGPEAGEDSGSEDEDDGATEKGAQDIEAVNEMPELEEEEAGIPRKKRRKFGFDYQNWCWEYGPESSSNGKMDPYSRHG